MARIRTIKPDYYTSLTTADLSLGAFAMFPGLLTHSDDEGRFVDDARLVKAALMPLRDKITVADVDAFLDEYVAAGMLVRYRVDGRPYGQVTGFDEHQRVNRPTPSKHPAAPPRESSPDAHAQLSEDSPPEGKGTGNREGNREEEPPADAGPDDDQPDADVVDLDQRRAPRDEFGDDIVDAVKTIAGQIAENGHPLPAPGSSAGRAWYVELDRLVRLGPPGQTTVDPPSLERVLEVARWATTDEFWRANVRSIPKVREKWSQLDLQANRNRDGPRRRDASATAAAYAATAEELRRQGL